jgi:hypothetical protein
MRINYRGSRDKYYSPRSGRGAEISYDEEKEQELFEMAVENMDFSGYDIVYLAAGLGWCKVEDYDEYKEFKDEWHKQLKRARKDLKEIRKIERR